MMTETMTQRFKALLYYMLIILAVYITGCRSNAGDIASEEDPAVTTSTSNNNNSNPTTSESTVRPIVSIESAVVSIGTVNITHECTDGDEDRIVSIECQRKAQGATIWQTYAIGQINGNSCSDGTPNTGYQVYRIHVIYTDGSDLESNETPSLLAILPTPTAFAVTDTGALDHLSWTYNASYTSTQVAGYQIQYQSFWNSSTYPSVTTYYTSNISNMAIQFANIDPCVSSFYDHAQFRVKAVSVNSNVMDSPWTPFSYNLCP